MNTFPCFRTGESAVVVREPLYVNVRISVCASRNDYSFPSPLLPFRSSFSRFEEFSKETLTIGEERVAGANDIADALIMAGHNDAALIAEWKDNLNDAWADLGELIETRKMMLSASWELHKFFYDCKEVFFLRLISACARGLFLTRSYPYPPSIWNFRSHCHPFFFSSRALSTPSPTPRASRSSLKSRRSRRL